MNVSHSSAERGQHFAAMSTNNLPHDEEFKTHTRKLGFKVCVRASPQRLEEHFQSIQRYKLSHVFVYFRNTN